MTKKYKDMKSIEQKVIRFITQYELIKPGDKVLIALSGGPDSVFALHFLNKFRRKYKIELTAAHINHQLRGKGADKDELFSEELCKNLDIPFYTTRLDVKAFAKKNKLSIEEAARKLRYQNLEGIAKEFNYTKIITAHNQSDNTETVLLNFFTGTGFSGIMGIPVVRGSIIRPILCLTKKEIMDYLSEQKICYRIDSSNLKNDYKRNFLRNKIIPQLKEKFNPSLDIAVFRSSMILEKYLKSFHSYLDQIIKEHIKISKESISIQFSLFESSPDGILGEAAKKVLKEKFDHEFDYGDYLKLKSLFTKQKGKKVQLSSVLEVVRESNAIIVRARQKVVSPDTTEIRVGEEVKIGNHLYGIEESKKSELRFNNSGSTEFIAADKLDNIFNLRRWKSGDRFIPLGMKNSRKISDFLTDNKIPSAEKKNKLVLLNRNNIVWIVGLRIDDRFKINSKTKKIVKLWMN